MSLARSTIRTAGRALGAGPATLAGPSRLSRPSRRAASLYSPQVAGLTDEENELRESVQAFARAEIEPIADKTDKENAFPQELWPKLGEQGLLGLTVPEEYGGLGKSYFEHLLVMEELSRASGSIALSYGAHSNLCVNQLSRWGTKAQKEKYLPDLISGKKAGSLAMSEPGSGSDVVSMRTRAEKKGDRYILNGSKMWITNGDHSGTLIVYAKTSPEKGSKGISAFLIERGMKGFSSAQKLDKVGMRGSNTCELVFEDVEVPEENVLGPVDGGAKVLMSGLDLERLVLTGGPLGLMQAAVDYAIPYVHERKQFGVPVGTFQLMQGKIADMYTKLNAARAYAYAIGRACSAGNPSNRDCAGVILYASDRAVEVTNEAMQMLGGNGYVRDYPVERFVRDARLYTVGAGTQEVRRLIIGRAFNTEFGAAPEGPKKSMQ